MCQILYRSGMQWAADTIRDLAAMTDLDELINIVSRGKMEKPKSFADGVQVYIDELYNLRDLRKTKRRGRKSC